MKQFFCFFSKPGSDINSSLFIYKFKVGWELFVSAKGKNDFFISQTSVTIHAINIGLKSLTLNDNFFWDMKTVFYIRERFPLGFHA